MVVQSFDLISSFFLMLRFIFAHLAKIAIKRKCVTRLPQSLAKMKSLIKVNSRAKFAVNLMDIQGVMSVYTHKKDQTSVMATGMRMT